MKKSVLSLIFFFYFFVNTQCYSNWLKTSFEDSLYVTSFGIDSLNSVYAGSHIGLFASFDGANNWKKKDLEIRYVNYIMSHIDNTFKMPLTFVCYNNSIVEIVGGGYQYFGEIDKINPTSICFYNDEIGYLVSAYGSFQNGGVFEMDLSLELGWRSLNNGLPIENDSIKALDIINKNDTLFVALSNGLYYSTNEAEFWEPIQFFDSLEIDKFVLNSKNDLYFIVSGTEEKSGLYKNLEKVFDAVLPLSAVAINRNDDVFVSSSIKGKGVFWTNDNGTDWQEMYDGLDSGEVTALICDIDGYIYAGTNGQGIFKSLKSTTKVEEINTDKLSVLPNPFPNKTKISFNLEEPSYTKITIYNSLGYILDILVDEYLSKGRHEFTFEGSALASGTYYYVLQSNRKVETGQLILIK